MLPAAELQLPEQTTHLGDQVITQGEANSSVHFRGPWCPKQFTLICLCVFEMKQSSEKATWSGTSWAEKRMQEVYENHRTRTAKANKINTSTIHQGNPHTCDSPHEQRSSSTAGAGGRVKVEKSLPQSAKLPNVRT